MREVRVKIELSREQAQGFVELIDDVIENYLGMYEPPTEGDLDAAEERAWEESQRLTVIAKEMRALLVGGMLEGC